MRPVDASLINRAILDNAHRLSDERLEAWICALRDREETLVEELGIVRAGLQALDAEQWRRHAETLKEDNHGEEKENV